MRSLYLDHASASPLRPEVVDHLHDLLDRSLANPASRHAPGLRAATLLRRARLAVSTLLGVDPECVLFTSGGTEANHAAILGTLQHAGPGDRVVVGGTEHASIAGCLELLGRRGVETITVGPDCDGWVDPGRLLEATLPSTRLVSLHWVNHETGVVQEIAKVAEELLRRRVPFHVDAVQAAGKIPLDLSSLPGVRTLAISGPKLGAPAGIGALALQPGHPLEPWLRGGTQERGLRGGTVNLFGASALGVAAECALRDLSDSPATRPANELFEEELGRQGSRPVRVHGIGRPRVGTVSNLAFEGVSADELLDRLSANGVYASAGSACHAGSGQPSPVLLAMGIDPDEARRSVRFSFPTHWVAEDLRLGARIVAQCADPVACDPQ